MAGNNNSLGRIFLSLIYLGLLFGGGGWVYYRIQHFEGIVVVGEGKAENLALQPIGQGNLFGASYRNLPFDVLPLLNPQVMRKVLDPQTHYNANDLPATLHLSKIEIRETGAPEEWIEAQFNGAQQRIPARKGETFRLGEEKGEVLGVAPWTGLIAHPQGSPLALVRVQDAETESHWSDKLFLKPKNWLYYKDCAVYFDWFPNETAARNAFPAQRPGTESARWGIEDNKRIHWLNSFNPGTGIQLDNGDDITLLGVKMDDTVPAILIQIKRTDNTASRIRILAGEIRNGIHFEYPAVKENVVYVHAWQDDAYAIQNYPAPADGKNSSALEPTAKSQQKMDAPVQVVQTLQKALPVDTAGDPVYEARVRLGETEYELREGQRVALNDAVNALQYKRMPPPTSLRYHLNASFALTPKQESFTLRDDESHRLGNWYLRLHPDIKPAPGTIVLLAERGLGGPTKYLGLTLFILGTLGWVFARFLKSAPHPRNHTIEDKLDALLEEEGDDEK